MTEKKACSLCEIEKSKEFRIIYQDKKAIAALSPNPSSKGHVLLMPKEHYHIFEQVPDFIVSHLSKIANMISISVFEALHAKGTNILIQNGLPAGQKSPHFLIHIIPRYENDSINFQWASKQLKEEEMSTIELMLKEESKGIGNFKKEEDKPIKVEKKIEKIEKHDNYLIHQLERIP